MAIAPLAVINIGGLCSVVVRQFESDVYSSYMVLLLLLSDSGTGAFGGTTTDDFEVYGTAGIPSQSQYTDPRVFETEHASRKG